MHRTGNGMGARGARRSSKARDGAGWPWETSERPMDDALAISTVIKAVGRQTQAANVPDVGTARVALSQLRLGIDQLETDVFVGA
jgi:hypothetical protein